MSALAALSLFLVISSGLSFPGKDSPGVEPEYLDNLLNTGQYELFAKIMNIPDAKFVRPNEDARSENPMFNEDLPLGDIMPVFGKLEEEESRQGMRLDVHTSYRWPDKTIAYVIKRDDFTPQQLSIIDNSIGRWNNVIRCPKLKLRNRERDYVYVFSGSGCWSYLGRIGNQQSLSLQQNGCVSQGTVLHEFQHAAGFAHEHNRHDRDNHVEVLWNNIPDNWKSQYEKTNPNDFGLQHNYDYYSIMHYPMKAPGTNRDAFRIKASGIDTNRIGRGNDFTNEDIRKINTLHC